MKKSFTPPKLFIDCNYTPTTESQEVVAKETSTLLEIMNSSISLWLVISTKSMKLMYNVTRHYKVYPYVVQVIIHTHFFGWESVEGNRVLKIILNYQGSISQQIIKAQEYDSNMLLNLLPLTLNTPTNTFVCNMYINMVKRRHVGGDYLKQP